jgi:hypothetical protein
MTVAYGISCLFCCFGLGFILGMKIKAIRQLVDAS